MEISEHQFVQQLTQKILSLPFDLKVCFALIADEDQPEVVRMMAAGSAVYVLGPNDIIPDHLLPVGFADDAVILWAVFDWIRREHPETAAKFAERFEGIFEDAGETAAIFSGYLGELYDWLVSKVPDLDQLVYKGKKAADYVADPEAGDFLYHEAMAFVTDFDLDEEYLKTRLRGKLVVDALAKRAKDEQLRGR